MSFREQDEDFEVISTHQVLSTVSSTTLSSNVGGSPTAAMTTTTPSMTCLSTHGAVAVLKKQSVDNCEDPLSAFLITTKPVYHSVLKDDTLVVDIGAKTEPTSTAAQYTTEQVTTTNHPHTIDAPPNLQTTHTHHHSSHQLMKQNNHALHDNRNDLFMTFSTSKLQSTLASKFTFLANKAAITIQDAVQNATKGHSHSNTNINTLQGYNTYNNNPYTASSASDNQQNATAVDGYGMMHRSTSWNSTSPQTNTAQNLNTSTTTSWNARTSNLNSSSFKGSTSTTSIVSIPELDNEKKKYVLLNQYLSMYT